MPEDLGSGNGLGESGDTSSDIVLADVERSLAPSGAGSNLHDLALYWASSERPRFKRLYKGWHLAQKGMPRRVPGDDNFRAFAQNEKELVLMVNPTHSDFFMHYDKEQDIVHFIVNGQAAIVPTFWLKSFTKNFRFIQAGAGHALAVPQPRRTKGTLKEHIQYRVKLLREFIKPTGPKLVVDPMDTSISDEIRHIAELQSGEPDPSLLTAHASGSDSESQK